MIVRRNRLAAVFLGAWLIGWVMGEGFAARQLVFGHDPAGTRAFLLLWLAGWTVAGVLAVRHTAWTVAGREEIAVEGRSLSLRWAAGPFGRTRIYDLGHVRNIREEDARPGASLVRGVRFTYPGRQGTIAFDYGRKTIRFGADLEGEDRRRVLGLVRERAQDPRG